MILALLEEAFESHGVHQVISQLTEALKEAEDEAIELILNHNLNFSAGLPFQTSVLNHRSNEMPHRFGWVVSKSSAVKVKILAEAK